MIQAEDDEFQMVKTGNGYANDLAATTIKRLEQTIIELRQLGQQMLSLDKSQQNSVGATQELKKTIVQLDNQSNKLNIRLLWLTVITTLVAIIQGLQTIKSLFIK